MPRERIFIQRAQFSFGYGITYGRENEDGSVDVMQPATYINQRPGYQVQEAFSLREESCQELLNQLWNLGFRPTDATGSTGHVRAVENHATNLNQIIDKLFVELSHR